MTKFLDAAGITRLVGGIIDRKEYSNLETTNKTISGAINELKNSSGGGGTLPEEYYQETYLKLQVPNSLDWTLIPAYEAWSIIALTSSNSTLESVDPYLDGSGIKEIRYIDYNEADYEGFPCYKINNADNTWRLYTYYDEYTEETPVINEEDFIYILDLNAFDAIINSFRTHIENQSFQLKFAAEKLTAGEGIIIDDQNKINASIIGEVSSKSWVEADLGESAPEGYYPPWNLNINSWIIIPSNWDRYYIINFLEGLYGEVYEDNPIYLDTFSEIEWELGGQVLSDFDFLPDLSDINYIYLNGPKPYFTYNGTTYAIIYASASNGKASIDIEELNFTDISPNVAASVYMGEKSFIYDDNEGNYYLNYQDMELQLNLEITFLDSEGNTMYPSFLMHSYLYQWNDNIYLWDTNSYPGFLIYYNIINDIVEDRTNNTVTITLHEITAESLGFNITFFDEYDELSFYLDGYFASSFWRKKFINFNTLENIDNLYFDFVYSDLYSYYPKLHYKLNKETGLWESRIKGDYFLSQGSGEFIFPNRFAIEAISHTNNDTLFCLNTSYFCGPVEIDIEDADVSDWSLHFRNIFQKTYENLIPNIYIYEHPEFSVLPKLISPTEYISILDTNKIIFNSNLVLNKDNVQSSFGYVINDEYNYTITSRATRSFSICSYQCLALSISQDYQGSLSFSFVDPIEETGKLVDNVKVYFTVNNHTVSAYCMYAGVGTIKPRITYKIIPTSELGGHFYDNLKYNQNDAGSEEESALCFKVDLGLHDGVTGYIWFVNKYPEEKTKWYQGMVELNMTVNNFYFGNGFYYKIADSPGYYEENTTSGDYDEYATPKLKYLPYMRDKNTVVSATTEPPIVIFGNQIDQTTGEPIPNPNYVNYDMNWTEVPEKTGLIV